MYGSSCFGRKGDCWEGESEDCDDGWGYRILGFRWHLFIGGAVLSTVEGTEVSSDVKVCVLA